MLNFEETPTLVVEVTSENWRDDYVLKMAEYAYNNIPEYWLVDPKKQHFWIMSDPEGEFGYSKTECSGSQPIQSAIFPDLLLTADPVLNPPIVERLLTQQQALNRQQLSEAHQRAEQERQRAEQEHQRAQVMAEKLRDLGIDPESL